MTYELALKLKAAGFPLKEGWVDSRECFKLPDGTGDTVVCQVPTLEELIEACGNDFWHVEHVMATTYDFWRAEGHPLVVDSSVGKGSNALEAVARLWLALNKP